MHVCDQLRYPVVTDVRGYCGATVAALIRRNSAVAGGGEPSGAAATSPTSVGVTATSISLLGSLWISSSPAPERNRISGYAAMQAGGPLERRGVEVDHNLYPDSERKRQEAFATQAPASRKSETASDSAGRAAGPSCWRRPIRWIFPTVW